MRLKSGGDTWLVVVVMYCFLSCSETDSAFAPIPVSKFLPVHESGSVCARGFTLGGCNSNLQVHPPRMSIFASSPTFIALNRPVASNLAGTKCCDAESPASRIWSASRLFRKSRHSLRMCAKETTDEDKRTSTRTSSSSGSSQGPLYNTGGERTPPGSPWEPSYVEQWKKAIPQHTIYQQGLPRDRWTSLPVPKNWEELKAVLASEPVQDVLSDPQKRNYWMYHMGRTLYFFLSSFINQLLQIRVEPDLNPIQAGQKFRKELAAALKRIAMSGSRKDVVESATRLPSMERVRRLFGSILELYRRDCRNIFYGLYRAPYDASLRHRQFNFEHIKLGFDQSHRLSIETGERRSRGKRAAHEIRRLLQRRAADQDSGVVVVDDVFSDEDIDTFNDNFLIGDLSQYPKYYLQNFHWQSDGWMSTSSARAYEYTTETLFSGVQDAMQRQGFVPISEYVALRQGIKDVSEIDLLEVACGTGRLHTFIKDNWPTMRTVATDLSPFYLQEARANIEYFASFTLRVTGREITTPTYVQCRAEDLPFEESSFDIVSCTYLFHEIPMSVRHQAAAEMYRVLRAGGIAVITDSFQKGDQPEKDHVGALFPSNYHEPFYMNYFEKTDLVAIFQSKGFRFKSHQLAHLTKVLTFEKPPMEGENTTTLGRGGNSWAII